MTEDVAATAPTLRTPPEYCQYADGPCDQLFEGISETQAILLYPTLPSEIAVTIEAAVGHLRQRDPSKHWLTWKDFTVSGQVIFCEICKNMRFTRSIVADVTTLNPNLLFEIGFGLGLEQPVIPVRDTSFVRDHSKFEDLGMLDTIGYLDFQNAGELSKALIERLPARAIPRPPTSLNLASPLYVIKGPIETEGEVRLFSVLKKSPLRFRSYDVLETPRLSLHEARRQVAASVGIVANLLHPDRKGAEIHNARAALIAGIAMGSGKVVCLLQEGSTRQPIDYRDVVRGYSSPDQIERLLEPLIRTATIRLQEDTAPQKRLPEGLLERLDLGDVAAENEIQALRSYFVATAQFRDAKRGHARLVIGRKGSGKTAIFYAVRDAYTRRRSHLVLDLKPEGHQFTKLRDAVLTKLSPGLQEHTLVAFWNFILLSEMAHKILQTDRSFAERDPEYRERFRHLKEIYSTQVSSSQGDFSERLLKQVDELTRRFDEENIPATAGALTETLFREDIRDLDDALADYLADKDEVWILVDNLDKGWPTQGASTADILILRSLLEATRKLQRQLDARGLDLHTLVFLRNDIHDLLLKETSDRGKDTAIILDWPDPETLKEIVFRRIAEHLPDAESLDAAWQQISTPHVGVQDSFGYILQHTLMRPRDLLSMLHRTLEVAINRGHSKISEDDIRTAQAIHSEDLLRSTAFELRDVFPDVPDPLYVFLGCPVYMSEKHVHGLLKEAGLIDEQAAKALRLLLWFGFLGVRDEASDARYAYEVRYNVDKLLAAARKTGQPFVVHSAFRQALECIEQVV